MTERMTQPSARRYLAWPADYHEYVFKDGKFVGDFDNMYRHAKGIPWEQDTRCEQWYTEVGMVMIKAHAPYASILEVGCGLGYIAAKLRAFVRSDALDAFDVSPTAIEKAQRLHQAIRFYADDITKTAFKPRQRYELVVVKDLFWYVLAALPTVLRNLEACVAPGGWLYVCQSFPRLDEPFVGRDLIPNPEALLARLHSYIPGHLLVLHNRDFPDAGPMLHVLGVKS